MVNFIGETSREWYDDTVLDLDKTDGKSIFYVASVGNLCTVARLDVVESFLQRGDIALGSIEVKIVYETASK